VFTGVGCPRRRSLFGLVCLTGAAALSLGGGSSAAQETGDTGEGFVADGIRRSLWEWIPAGRRDPFVYRAQKEKVQTTSPVNTVVPEEYTVPTETIEETTTGTGGEVRDTRQLQLRAKRVAERLARGAFAALGRQEYTKAQEFVTDAMSRIHAAGFGDPPLEEKLKRLGDTAQRLKTRGQIEKEFRNLRIVIRGIVWEATGPAALVNDSVVREGDVIEGARVEEIRRDEVIFSLKGVRVGKTP
jgi:hypothetical protein